VDDAELDVLLRNERYPRSAGYSARWMVDGGMGPNPVWQAEALTDFMRLEPGMRVLDMGCGTALSSIFLAKEFGVEVWATDLWVKPDENLRRVAEAQVEDQVHPIHAEAHALPFAEDFFDALISPAWWRRHWEKTGLVTVEVADRLPDGWRDWLQWNEACDHANGTPAQEEAQMLHTDNGQSLGLTRLTAHRNT